MPDRTMETDGDRAANINATVADNHVNPAPQGQSYAMGVGLVFLSGVLNPVIVNTEDFNANEPAVWYIDEANDYPKLGWQFKHDQK